jgi:hypothetical protein
VIQEEVIKHAAFWEQDVCVKCGCIVGDSRAGEEVLLVECPRCGEEGRCSAEALQTLLQLIDKSEGEEE